MSHTYDYPRPALAVDIIIYHANEDGEDSILLIKRGNDPFKDMWALPGGYVNEGERLIDAAMRELEEETTVKDVPLTQEGTYGDPGRDPRGWVVSVVHLAILTQKVKAKGQDDAAEAQWFKLSEIPTELAFDHRKIIDEIVGGGIAA